MKAEKGYQQGDVILRRKRSMPKDPKRLSPAVRGYILAEGEATGHAHVLDVEPCEMYEKDGIIWVKVIEPAKLRHEEHHEQVIAPGVYQLGRVTEVDPFTEETRRVQD